MSCSSSPTSLVGADKVLRLPNPIMGAEDFSYVIQQIPGAMMFLGGTPRPQPGDRRAEPLQPGLLRRGGDDHRHGDVRRHGPQPPRGLTLPARRRAAAQGDQLEGAQRSATMPSLQSIPPVGSSSRLQRNAAPNRRAAVRTVSVVRSPQAS